MITVSAFDTPAYLGEEVPEDPLLLILDRGDTEANARTHRRPIIAANIARFGEGRDRDHAKRRWLDTGLPSASHVSARGLRLGAWR